MKNRKICELIIVLILIVCFIVPVHANDNVELTGDVIHVILPVAAVTITLSRKDHRGTMQFAESFFTTLAVTYTLKYLIDEKRPNGGEYSFPSGHTSESFSSASFIQRRYGWRFGIPAYAAATFVGWSRVESKNHYLHDVIAGALIGISSTYLFTRTLNRKVTVTSYVTGQSSGISLTMVF